MSALFVLSLLAAAPAPAADAAPVRVLVLGLQATGLDEGTVSLIDEVIAVELSRFEALQVVSGADVKRMVELESERQATGCEGESCLSEITDALGARYAVFGRVGKLGSQLVMTLNLFDSAKAVSIAREDIRAPNLDRMTAALAPAVEKLVAPVAAPPPPAGGSALPWIGMGVASAGGLGFFLTLGFDIAAETSHDSVVDGADIGFFIGELVGLAAIGAGVALMLWPEGE